MLTAQQDSLYYLVHTSDNQASCMLKKFTNIWSKLNLNSTIPELLSSKQAISPFHEACQMNEVIGGYLSGYTIASFLARRDLASLSRWPNLLLLSLSLRGCRRPAQNHPCVQREPGVGGGGAAGPAAPSQAKGGVHGMVVVTGMCPAVPRGRTTSRRPVQFTAQSLPPPPLF